MGYKLHSSLICEKEIGSWFNFCNVSVVYTAFSAVQNGGLKTFANDFNGTDLHLALGKCRATGKALISIPGNSV